MMAAEISRAAETQASGRADEVWQKLAKMLFRSDRKISGLPFIYDHDTARMRLMREQLNTPEGQVALARELAKHMVLRPKNLEIKGGWMIP